MLKKNARQRYTLLSSVMGVLAASLSFSVWCEELPVEDFSTGTSTGVSVEEMAHQPASPSDPVDDYLNAIDKAEIRSGAYSGELSDLYLGLANLLVKEGQFLEAKNAYQKGMQVTRINNGLHSLAQEPFLFSLADLDSALGDLQGANKAMSHILKINTETYGAADERMLPVLDKMLNWYLANYSAQSARDGFELLLNSEKLASHALVIHTESLDLSHEDLEEAYRKLSVVEYSLAKHVDRYGVPGEQEAFTYSFGQAANQVDREPALVDRYYRRGRDALKSVVKVLYERPDSSKKELAEAVAQLADWYGAFDRHRSAQEHYLLAHQLLGESEETKPLQNSFFSEPRLITFLMDQSVLADNGKGEAEGLDVTFDITERGVPRNLRLGERSEELKVVQLKKIKREVLRFRFRPQFQDGVMIGTKDYVYHYPVELKEQQHES